MKQTTRKHHYTITESATELGIIASGDDAFLLRLLAWRSILCSHCVACPLCNVADCCSIARSASASRRLSSYTRTMASVSARSASVRSAFAIRPLRYSSRRSSYFFCRVICSSSCKARSFAALSRDSFILPRTSWRNAPSRAKPRATAEPVAPVAPSVTRSGYCRHQT